MIKKFLKPTRLLFLKNGRKKTAESKSLYEGLIRLCIVSFFVLIISLTVGLVSANKAFAASPPDISLTDIQGVTAPSVGATPVSAITPTPEYTGTVAWSTTNGPLEGTFYAGWEYTATITLTPEQGYSLDNVTQNYFSLSGATSTNNPQSGVVTAVFPSIVAYTWIDGVGIPAIGGTPTSTITETDQFTGLVTWSPLPPSGKFTTGTPYIATITLTAKAGYTLNGATQNYFTVDGTAVPATNPANSGVITARFLETFAGGNGSVSAPYQVSTVSQLQSIGITDQYNQHPYINQNFELIKNIDASDTQLWNWIDKDPENGDPIPGYYQGFVPLGLSGGIFDGKGYSINNLYIDGGTNPIGMTGLFGYVDGGEIKNLTIGNATIKAVGGLNGVLAGWITANSTITNVHTSGSITPVEAGSFHIERLANGVFTEVYDQGFAVDYTTKNFIFSNIDGSFTLRINQNGRYEFAGIDAAILSVGGVDLAPVSAIYSGTTQSVLEDILKIDNNVVVSHNKPINITWFLPQGASRATLKLTANEYGRGVPMQFPENGTVSYTLGSNVKTIIPDGNIGETDGSTPSYTTYLMPSTGHPWGNVYLYFSDDSTNLYITADVTVDNTNDYNKDWFAVTVGNKRFVISAMDNTYGVCGFGLTSKVGYNHATCEMVIPKSQFVQTPVVALGFEYYGTAAYSAYGGIAGRLSNSTMSNSSSSVNITGSDAFAGFNWFSGTAGGLVGESNGSTVITTSYATGNVSATNAGGLVGGNRGTITQSYAEGDVSGKYNIGGLVGYAVDGSYISDTYSWGNVGSIYNLNYSPTVGGLIGSNEGVVRNSYSSGDVTNVAGSFGYSYTGGLIGLDTAPWSGDYGVSNCFSAGNITVGENAGRVGGLIGFGSDFNYSTANNYWYGSQITAYVLNYTPGTNGNISGTIPQIIIQGSNGSGVTAIPDVGYLFVRWSDGVLTATRTDLNVITNINVTAVFAIDPLLSRTLTYSSAGNGSISGVTSQAVYQGADGLKVTAVPAAGYQFVSWSDGVLTAERNDLDIQTDMTVTATFEVNPSTTYTLNYLAGANGSIQGDNPQLANEGSDGAEVIAIPNPGFMFIAWSDGVTTAARIDYGVWSDLTVTANFAINNSPGIGDGRSGSDQPILEGSTNYFKGTDVSTRLPFTSWDFVNIWYAHANGYPTFIPSVTFGLSYTAGANGSITGTTYQLVEQGADGSVVTAVPNTGYHFQTWSDGVLTATRSDLNVQNDIFVTAQFDNNVYTLTYTAGPNSHLHGTTPQTVNYGADGTQVTAEPDVINGYYFLGWSDGVMTPSRTDLNIQGGINVTALFAQGDIYYWSGLGITNNWSEPENWLVNGATALDTPGVEDAAIFDNTGLKDVTIDVPVNVNLLSFYQTYTGSSVGYTGVITVNENIRVVANLFVDNGITLPLGPGSGINCHTLTVNGYVVTNGFIVLANDINIGGLLIIGNNGVLYSSTGSIVIGGKTVNSGTIMTDIGDITINADFENREFINADIGNLTINGSLDATGSVFAGNNLIITEDLYTESDIHSVSLQVGGNVSINNGELYIHGSIDIDGNLTSEKGFIDTGIAGQNRGDVTIGGNVVLNGDVNGDSSIYPGNLNITGSLTGTRLYIQTYHSIVTGGLADIHGQAYIGENLNIGGSLVVDKYGNGQFEYGFVTAANITVNGSTTVINGSYLTSTNIATFSQDVDINTASFLFVKALTVIGNFTNQAGAQLSGSTGNWDFRGNFTNDATSIVTATSGVWRLAKNFTNNNPSNVQGVGFYHNYGSIEFTGIGSQQINGSTTFNNFKVDNRQKVLGDFSNTTSLDIGIEGHTIEIYNGYIYVLGGYVSGGVYLDVVRYTKINNDGTVGDWTISPNLLNKARAYHSSAVYNGYLYVVGGFDNNNDYSDVEYAKINSDGSIGTWTIATNELSSSRRYQASLAYNGFLYVIGGQDGAADTNITEYATLDPADGSVGIFTISGNSFVGGREELVSFVYDNYLYIVGGYGVGDYSDTQFAEINLDGSLGAWSASARLLPFPISYSTVAADNNKVYLIGGQDDNENYISNVYYTTINANHDINIWQELDAKISKPLIEHWGAVWNGYVYIVGGYEQSVGDASEVQFAQIDPPIISDKTLIFEANKTTTIQGELFVKGDSSYQILLRSSNTDTQSYIDPEGTIMVDYLDIKDNNNLSEQYINPTNSIDSGNNTYWFSLKHTITSVTGTGGTITPVGRLEITEGGNSLEYTITTNPGYYLAYLLIDGVKTTATVTYQFTNVLSSHTIQPFYCSGTGPCIVKNIDGSWESYFVGGSPITVIGEKLFFSSAESEESNTLWCSDGTDSGTYSLSAGLHNISRLVSFEDKLYFTANYMGGQELWTSDGTVGGTHLVEDFYPVDPFHPEELTIIWNLHIGNNIMFMTVSKGLGGDASLWKSDGTSSGTVLVKELEDVGYSIVFGDNLFYTTCSGGGCDLWISDGSPAGTRVVEHFDDTYEINSFIAFKNEVYFEVQDGMGYKANYKTDGNDTTFLFESSNFSALKVAGDYIFGSGWDALNGYELWAMNGAVGGLVMVLDINPGSDGSHPNDFIEMNGILYFTADDGSHGRELWRSDGTVGGTYMVKEILPGMGGILDFENAGNVLYFRVSDGEGTISLWTSDGTAEGTEQDGIIGSGNHFSLMEDVLYYFHDDEINGEELWFYNPNYVAPTYTIVGTAGANGSIIPSGENTVTLGDNLTFNISPSSGYHISDVLVDGVSIGAASSYGFTNVDSNHTISATFASNDGPVVPPIIPPVVPPVVPPTVYHSLAASVSYLLPDRVIGTGTPYGEVASWQSWQSFYSIDGGMITLNLALSPNSRVKDVLVDGVSVGPVNTYTFYNIHANHTIQAIVVKYANVTTQVLENGTITPESQETGIEDGQRYNFTVTPNKGYKIEDVLDNNESVNADNCYIEDGVAYCSIVIGAETTQGKDFVTQHDLSASVKVLGVSNFTEPEKKEVELGFFALVVQDFKLLLEDFGAILANVFDRAEQFIASTPPPVAYFFPYLLFILLGILIWRLGAQAKNEAFNAQKLVKLLDFEKNIATQKESFMVLSSHYLRTPMTIINSGVDLYLTINKVTAATAVLLRGSVQAIANKVEYIFGEVDKNSYLKSINMPEVKQEKIRIYTSPLLILPIIFVALTVVIANFLFETVASININVVNYLIQGTFFVILGVVLFTALRKRETQKANKTKFDLLIAQQVAVDEARNRFITEVANDLEKEVNILEGEISEVKDKTAVKEIQKGIADMKSMIAKFAFLSSIEAGKAGLRNQKLDTSTLISQSLKAEESEIAAKGIKVNLPEKNIGVSADKQKLFFILSSLIDNAAKFNKDSGQIDISAHNGGKDVEISIEDTGIGISEEGQKMLFQPFSHTTDLMQFNYQGMGTNLFIAKLVANYMGGDIAIKSQENQGTKVTVLLPVG
ncbi:MAG: ATP-binding protein [bacterium]